MKRFMNLLAIMVVMVLLVACGVKVPENSDITFTNKEYYPNLHIENIYVQSTENGVQNRDVNQDDIDKIMKVFQTTYKGVSIGDTVDKLDAIYGEHITHIAYYGNDMRFGKSADFTFVWGDEEIQISVPASYTDKYGDKIAPLSVNKDMMSIAYKRAKEIGMSKEDMLEEVKAQFFQPMVLIADGVEAIRPVEFEKINNDFFEELKEAKLDKEVASRDDGYDIYEEDPLHKFHIDPFGIVYTGNFVDDVNYEDPSVMFWYVDYYVGDMKVSNVETNLTVRQLMAKAERKYGNFVSYAVWTDEQDNIIYGGNVYNGTDLTARVHIKVKEYIGAQGSTLEPTDITLETADGTFMNGNAIARLGIK